MSETPPTQPLFPPAAAPVPPAAVPKTAHGTQTQTRQGDGPATASTGPAPVRQDPAGPRRVRLTVSRIDPWSVMKLGFLLSIAAGIVLVVATALVWSVLNEMQVFAKIQDMVNDIGAQRQFGQILEYMEFSRVLSAATVIAVFDIVLLTALSTLGAFIYNFVAAMVGGLHLTLTDD